MQTKKVLQAFGFFLLMAIAMPARSSLMGRDSIPASHVLPPEDARMQQLNQRLAEIKGTDMSTLSRLEKKNLKKEVRHLKKESKNNKGVYLSVGAIIIIILLLILIL